MLKLATNARIICPPRFRDDLATIPQILVPTHSGDRFASSIATCASGRILAIGAPRHSGPDGKTVYSGAVFLFRRDRNFVSSHTILGPGYEYPYSCDSRENMYFGQAVSLCPSGNFLAVSAYGDRARDGSGWGRGAVYIFDMRQNAPTLHGVIGHGYNSVKDICVNLTDGLYFGSSVAINSALGIVAVGAHHSNGRNNNSEQSGEVYIFRFDGPGLTQGVLSSRIGSDCDTGQKCDRSIRYLDIPINPHSFFGYSVALHPKIPVLAVGARGDNGTDGAVSLAGAVFMFNIPQRQKPTLLQSIRRGSAITIPLQKGTMFGMRVSFAHNGRILLVSAAGSARARSPDGGVWALQCEAGLITGISHHFNAAEINAISGGLVNEFSWYDLPCVAEGRWIVFGIDYDLKSNPFRTETAFAVIAQLSAAVRFTGFEGADDPLLGRR